MSDASETDAMGLVQADIEETRHELQQTVDELAERLNPKHRMDDARDAVEDAAQRAVTHAGEVARQTVEEVKQLRTMSPDEAAAAARGWVADARRWLDDDRHRKMVLEVAAVAVLLMARRRRRHRRH